MFFSYLPTVLAQAREMSVNMFVVGINASNELDMNEIEEMVDYQQSRIFIKNNFTHLQDVVQALQSQISSSNLGF